MSSPWAQSERVLSGARARAQLTPTSGWSAAAPKASVPPSLSPEPDTRSLTATAESGRGFARRSCCKREKPREKVAAAERDNARAYGATIDAGWTPAELRKIGFAEAAQKRAPRKRQTRKPTSSEATATPPADAAQGGDENQSCGG